MKELHKIFALRFFWSFILIQTIAVPYFNSLNLSYSEILTIQGVFLMAMSILEIPSGVLSDLIGPKKSILIASVLKAIGGICLLFSKDITSLCISYAILGFGNSFFSGADIVLLKAKTDDVDNKFSEKYFTYLTISSLSLGVSGLSSLLLFYSDFQFILIMNAVFALIPLLLALWIKEVEVKKTNRISVVEVLNYSKTLINFRSLCPITVSLFILALHWGGQKFLLQKTFDIKLIGLFYFISSMITLLFKKQIGKMFKHQIHLYPAFAMAILIGYIDSAYAASVSLFFIQLLLNVLLSNDMAEFNKAIPDSIRSTVNSILNLAGRLIYIGILPAITYVSETHSFIALFGILFLFIIIVHWRKYESSFALKPIN
jgi:MFS family permease